MRLFVAALLAGSAGCTGIVGDEGGPAVRVPGPTEDALATVGWSGLRRLTTHEYDNVLHDLLGDDSHSANLVLPEDVRTPFDNDQEEQVASQALVDGLELLAADAVERLMLDAERLARVVGCTPTGPGDTACLTSFIRSFGRRALRRTLTGDEVARFAALGELGVEAGDFNVAIDALLRFFLQHPELVYRVELGAPVEGRPGVYALGDFEIASRLSFFLWSSGPDDALLDLAEAGALHTSEQIRSAARTMLADARATAALTRFHALWLGYEHLHVDNGGLTAAMRRESDALVERVVFTDRRPWLDLFRLRETFVDADLAAHYGLAADVGAEGAWVPYPATEDRAGLLGHATLLSNGGEVEETMPIHRGLWVREQLLCQPIGDPPPDIPPLPAPAEAGDACKKDRLVAHTSGGCAACHSRMDPIGFGLEQYDQLGRFREHEPDRPECAIDGEGDLDGVAFRGPAELGERLITSGALADCLSTQVYRYAMGRRLDTSDAPFLEALRSRLPEDAPLDDLIVELVASEGFRYRRSAEE